MVPGKNLLDLRSAGQLVLTSRTKKYRKKDLPMSSADVEILRLSSDPPIADNFLPAVTIDVDRDVRFFEMRVRERERERKKLRIK